MPIFIIWKKCHNLLESVLKHRDGRATVIPVHPGRDIGRGLLRKILSEIEIDREEFLEYI